MNEREIVDMALARLESIAGINAQWKQKQGEIDGEIDLYFKDKDLHFYVEVKKEVRNHQLPFLITQAKRYHPLMIIAEKIYPAVKEQLRENKIPYLDTAGNIYVDEPGKFVWIEGNKPIKVKKGKTNKAFTKTGLKVIFHLLLNPDAINHPYRKLAEATGVALGAITDIMHGLKQGDFILQINKTTVRLHKKRELLERWITGYQETLKPTLHLGTYRFWDETNLQNWEKLILEKNEGVWGGEPAAEILTNYLKAATLTIYADEKNTIFRKWVLVPDPDGNVIFYRKFWIDEWLKAEQHAPPLLVYADLMITDDPRCHETAQIIYDKFLKETFK